MGLEAARDQLLETQLVHISYGLHHRTWQPIHDDGHVLHHYQQPLTTITTRQRRMRARDRAGARARDAEASRALVCFFSFFLFFLHVIVLMIVYI